MHTDVIHVPPARHQAGVERLLHHLDVGTGAPLTSASIPMLHHHKSKLLEWVLDDSGASRFCILKPKTTSPALLRSGHRLLECLTAFSQQFDPPRYVRNLCTDFGVKFLAKAGEEGVPEGDEELDDDAEDAGGKKGRKRKLEEGYSDDDGNVGKPGPSGRRRSKGKKLKMRRTREEDDDVDEDSASEYNEGDDDKEDSEAIFPGTQGRFSGGKSQRRMMKPKTTTGRLRLCRRLDSHAAPEIGNDCL